MSSQVAAKSSEAGAQNPLEQLAVSRVAISQKRLFWRRFRRHKLALIAEGALGVLIVLVLLASVIAPYEFDAIDPLHGRQPPSAQHWLG